MKEMVALVTDKPEYKAMEAELQEAVQDEAEVLEDVTDLAMAEYESTDNKHPHEAITIKEFAINEILDEEKAREWCFANFHPGLVLDDKAFVGLAKQGKVPPELVSSYMQYKATISQDLSKYLPDDI
jgi:hypothetical protein